MHDLFDQMVSLSDFQGVNGRNLTINHGETLLLYALQKAHRGHIEFDL